MNNYTPAAGDMVIYKKPLETRYNTVYAQQSIPCKVIAVYENGTVSVQPLNTQVSKKVVKQKHLIPLTH